MQSPGGSGALRVAAELILRADPNATIWVSDPTWNNHVPLLGGAGLNLRPYPYYDTQANRLLFDEMMEALEGAEPGELLLLHGCCHNPTGMDLSREQWQALAELVEARGLVPFIDLAYQGFAEGIDEDAYGVQLMYQRAPELVVTQSCSKNFGLYRDRAGALSFVAADPAIAKTVDSQALSVVRTMYSVPPDHGAAVVARILNDEELSAEWLDELAVMRARLVDMRRRLVEELRKAAPGHDFSHIERTTGMFCYLGVSAEQVARLKEERGVYLVDSGRINVCGITPGNVRSLAESVAGRLGSRFPVGGYPDGAGGQSQRGKDQQQGPGRRLPQRDCGRAGEDGAGQINPGLVQQAPSPRSYGLFRPVERSHQHQQDQRVRYDARHSENEAVEPEQKHEVPDHDAGEADAQVTAVPE